MEIKNNYRVLIVSGGNSPQVVDRLNKLGIREVFMSVTNKKEFITDYIKKNVLTKDQVLYMADDLPDLPVMSIVGVPCCPSDAVPEIREAVSYISPLPGGLACVRDVIEKVLKLNDQWHFREDVQAK